VATALWVAAGPGGGGGATAVLVSFGVPLGTTTRLSVTLSPVDPSATPPPWPRWHPTPAPAWQRCPVGVWCGLPHLGPSEAVLRRCAQRQEAREGAIERDIDGRCGRIQQHGDDDAFTESLDYYTTQRVKLACLHMNAQGLRERLTEVQQKTEVLGRVLLAAPSDLAAQWAPPRDVPAPLESDPTPPSDPNTLCVPQRRDYELPGATGYDDGGAASSTAVCGPGAVAHPPV
jgi:hypothetical protein